MHKEKISIVLFIFLFGTSMLAFALQGGKETVVIQTSGHCEYCEKDIVRQLKKQTGVKTVNMDKGSGKVTVVFNANKISADSLRGTLNVLGYDADHRPAKNRLSKLKREICTEK